MESAVARAPEGAVAVFSEVTRELYLAYWDADHSQLVLGAPRNPPEPIVFRANDSFLYPFVLLATPQPS